MALVTTEASNIVADGEPGTGVDYKFVLMDPFTDEDGNDLSERFETTSPLALGQLVEEIKIATGVEDLKVASVVEDLDEPVSKSNPATVFVLSDEIKDRSQVQEVLDAHEPSLTFEDTRPELPAAKTPIEGDARTALEKLKDGHTLTTKELSTLIRAVLISDPA